MPNGQPKWLLCFIPSYPLLNFLLTTTIYLFISYRVFNLTNFLKTTFIPSKDNKRLCQNFLAGVTISLCLYFISLVLLHVPGVQAMIGEDGKADWEEILDKKLVGHNNPEEVSLLADIAYKCLGKIQQKRPSIIDVRQVISRIRRHLAIKSETLPSLGSDPPAVLRRIENQHVELSKKTNLMSSLSLKVMK